MPTELYQKIELSYRKFINPSALPLTIVSSKRKCDGTIHDKVTTTNRNIKILQMDVPESRSCATIMIYTNYRHSCPYCLHFSQMHFVLCLATTMKQIY